MKKHEKEIEQALLNNEKDVYKRLENSYSQALKDVDKKYKELQDSIDELIEKQSRYTNNPKQLEIIKSQIQSKIYQKNYQKALKEQLDSAMDVLKSDHVKTVNDYLNTMYEDGYLSQLYSLQKYDIPVLAPINHELMVKAVSFKFEDIPLSKRLYENIDKAKQEIMDEISRGIATGMSQNDIARNIKECMGVSYRKAKQLAQNEGHRVVNEAKLDSMRASKERGADIVKVWDCTFDKKTRPIHAQLDGKHAEIDGYFEYSSGQVFAPKKFGKPALDINCRCALLSVPRWDIENTVIKRDNITGELIEAKNYADWKEKYYNVSEKYSETVSKIVKSAKDAKSFLELKQYCKEKFDITIDDSVEKLDFDSVKQPISGIESVIAEFPDVKDKFNSLITSSSGVMSCRLDGHITYNPNYFKIGNDMGDIIQRQIVSKWWPNNSSLASIGCHETAHALESVLIDLSPAYSYEWQKIEAWNKCTEAKNIVSQACKNIKKTEYGKGKKNAELIHSVSGYASKNASETMAEAFADVFANGDKANPLSLEIKKVTTETYKKYKGGS